MGSAPDVPPLEGSNGFVEDPTDRDYATAARAALAQRNYRLAFQQIGAALALAPLDREHMALCDQIADRAPGPLQHLPPTDPFFGLHAVRGRVLGSLGRRDEALEVLLNVVSFRPATPFLLWTRSWSTPPKSKGKKSREKRSRGKDPRPETLVAGALELAAAVAELELPLAEGVQANVIVAREHLAALSKRHPARVELIIAEARLYRAERSLDQARALALSLPESWEREVELAAIARVGQKWEDALAALERAHELRDDDTSSLLDIGALSLELGRWERARQAYRQVAQLDPGSVWATAGQRYARWLSGEEVAHAELMVSDDPAADAWAASLERAIAAYGARLPDPVDPLIGVLRQVDEQLPHETASGPIHVKVRGDRPAAPSAQLVFDAIVASHDRGGELTVDSEHAEENRWPPWNEDVAPPAEALAAALGKIAASPFDREAWNDAASELAGEHSLYALRDATVWLPAEGHPDRARRMHGVQLAAALAIAAHPDKLERRQQALATMLAARDDWVSAAAAIGLWRLAELEPTVRDEVVSALLAEAGVAPMPVSACAVAVALRALGPKEPRAVAARLLARLR